MPEATTLEQVERLRREMTAWRRELHAHPETAYEKRWTSDFIASQLLGLGVDVHRGLAGTGVVGTLRGLRPGPAIALRADMDALAVEEKGEAEHRSLHAGRMHACGHDGHMAMLLGAAKHLATTRAFAGTVHFVFQPAEENEGGGRRMVEEGLFERFPAEAVFGLHNWPGLEKGALALRPGPVMAALDTFDILVRGRGAHAAQPHLGVDPIVVAAHVVTAAQTLVSRSLSPLDAAVVSVTRIDAGDTWNVIPEEARMRGTVRTLRGDVQDQIEEGLRRIGTGVASALGAALDLRYERRYPATVNHPEVTERAARAARRVLGEARVLREMPPQMASEDFAFLAAARPACFAFLGTGAAAEGAGLHCPGYDFNDEVLVTGAAYWVSLVEHAT